MMTFLLGKILTLFVCSRSWVPAMKKWFVEVQNHKCKFSIWAEGTTKWLWAIAERFGISKAKFDAVVAAPKLRAEQAVAAVADGLRGNQFLFP